MYNELFLIIQQYIFEAQSISDLTPYQELVCTNIATIGCISMIALPFVIVFWAVKRFF